MKVFIFPFLSAVAQNDYLSKRYIYYYFLSVILLPCGQIGALSRGRPHTRFLTFRPEGHHELCNEVASLSPAERLVGFEPETF